MVNAILVFIMVVVCTACAVLVELDAVVVVLRFRF